MKKVFISHSSLDKDFIDELADNLRHNGIHVWYSKWNMRVGDSLREKISEGIEGSDFMVVVLSPNSIHSSWVKDELNAGLAKSLESQSVFVLPLFLAGEDNSLPVFLKDKLCADFRKDYNDGFRQLLEVISGQKHPEVKFISKRSSKVWQEVLNDLPARTKYALHSFTSSIEDSAGTAFIEYTLNISGAYEADLEMWPTVDSYDSLKLYGLVTSTVSMWNLHSRPKVYRLAGKLTRLGYLIAKELGYSGIAQVNFQFLPER
jgi:hypothetical protein